MTRVNLVDVTILSDQHLMAEWREITRVPAVLRKSIEARSVKGAFGVIPSEFCLNRGHVMFFYDKRQFLCARHREITSELVARGFNLSRTSDYADLLVDIPPLFCKRKWSPSNADISVSAERIIEKLDKKRYWYRFHGSVLPDVVYLKVARLVI